MTLATFLAAYHALRVDAEKRKCESARCLPPVRLGPLSSKPHDLHVNRHFGSFGITETPPLPKFAP